MFSPSLWSLGPPPGSAPVLSMTPEFYSYTLSLEHLFPLAGHISRENTKIPVTMVPIWRLFQKIKSWFPDRWEAQFSNPDVETKVPFTVHMS